MCSSKFLLKLCGRFLPTNTLVISLDYKYFLYIFKVYRLRPKGILALSTMQKQFMRKHVMRLYTAQHIQWYCAYPNVRLYHIREM